jgi:hypothetical protein
MSKLTFSTTLSGENTIFTVPRHVAIGGLEIMSNSKSQTIQIVFGTQKETTMFLNALRSLSQDADAVSGTKKTRKPRKRAYTKKADSKKADSKKVDSKKADSKKADSKKADSKKRGTKRKSAHSSDSGTENDNVKRIKQEHTVDLVDGDETASDNDN